MPAELLADLDAETALDAILDAQLPARLADLPDLGRAILKGGVRGRVVIEVGG